MVLSVIYRKKTFPKEYSSLSNQEKVNLAKKILNFHHKEKFNLAKRLLEEADEDSEAKLGLAIIHGKERLFSSFKPWKSKIYLMEAYFQQHNLNTLLLLIDYFGHEADILEESDFIKAQKYIQKGLYNCNKSKKFEKMKNLLERCNQIIKILKQKNI